MPAVGLLGSGLAAVVGGVYLINKYKGVESDVINPGGLLVVLGIPLVLAGVPFTASAVYGYRRTARCRELNRTLPPVPPPPAFAPTAAPAPEAPPSMTPPPEAPAI